LGEQAGGPAIVIEQLRIIRILSQGFLKSRQGLRQFPGFEQSDAERVFSVRLLKVWYRFGGIPLRQELISKKAVGSLEVRVEFKGALERRNRCCIIALLDVDRTEIGEGGCEFGIELDGLSKFGHRRIQLPALFRL